MRRVLIANRGEIALRAMRACRKAGLESVAVHSEADAASPHIWAADAAVCIGPPPAAASYLREEVLIDVARRTGCDAVYPGYGFLSERAGFAERCRSAGLTFIGPSPEAIAMMGDKAEARRRVAALGVPVVPGSTGTFRTVDEAVEAAGTVGFPLLMKATAGGGGRGMRVARSVEEFRTLLPQAVAEAEAAFGNGEVYLERFFDRVRHVEVQVFGDRHGTARHVWERDCSVQRRHQKLVEEAPSPALDPATRRAMCEASAAIVEATGYEGAGTVEFIVDEGSGRFFFIEMNTRIQVEHPVTEMLTGHDLVVEQLRVAAGKRLSIPAAGTAPPPGHVIEWRICAEDPARNFQPSPGRITSWRPPKAAWLRFDSHVYPGYAVPPQYDSMIGKLIVRGDSRSQCLARSAAALDQFVVEGIATTIPFHRDLARHPDFLAARVHTRWIEDAAGSAPCPAKAA